MSSRDEHNEQMPPSFAPRSHSSSRSSQSSAPEATPTPASSQSQTTPPSFAPRSNTRSTQTTQGSSTTPARSSQSHTTIRSQATPRVQSPQPSQPNRSNAVSATRAHKPHRVRRIILSIFLILVLLIGILGFSAYNWVNNGLHREDWIPQGGVASQGTTWLLLGSDERDGTTLDDTPGERTDTILVLTKPKHGASSLISIPRDSLVQVDDQLLKINAVYQNYGRQELVRQIEDITGFAIDHVMKMSFGGLTDIVDALGGVQLCYDADVDDEKSELHWTAGCHVADGKTALAFSRMRYSDPKGDFGRAERQRQVIGAIVKKAASPSTLLHWSTLKKVGDATLDAITVDEATTPFTLLSMLMAFKSASSDQGVSGSVYWSNPDYYVDGVGSSVLLDNEANLQLFKELDEGTHEPGVVGSAAEL